MLGKREKRQPKKSKRIKPKLPGGFRDYGPREAIARQKIISTVRTTFERFGFDPMETPAVERTEILTGGEAESQKIIFNVRGSREKKFDTSLRFDLTVPLARFMGANPEIPRPFKRYQIGNVWRGESAQAGRYREFLQADIDIVGTKSLDADAEIVQVTYETLRALGVENFYIKMNNKNEALALLHSAGISKNRETATLIAVDKKDKLRAAAWEAEVKKASGLDKDALRQYLWKISGENMPEATEVRALREKTEQLGVPQKYLVYDASLVRGLGYYTGSIFEAVLTDLPSLGTVAGGGRYDGLIGRFSRDPIPAVGVSIGIDRLFAALEKLGKLPKQQTSTQVLILNLAGNLKTYNRFRQSLQAEGIKTSLYLGDDKTFQAQLAYAVKKEIPFVLVYGEKEEQRNVVAIKNLHTREQKEIPKENIAAYFRDL